MINSGREWDWMDEKNELDYSKAWEVFQKDYGGLSYEDFKANVFAYDEIKEEYVFKDLIKLIK
jgi:hypothetical protein